MIHEIEVKDVIELNNCAGRKNICVTSMADDESYPTKFRLTHGYLPPAQKLRLASVCPGDKVTVVVDSHFSDAFILGEFVEIMNFDYGRPAVCPCSVPMVSDGFDIYCPNPHCGLTTAARLERLGDTAFFRGNMLRYDEETNMWGATITGGGGAISAYNPFAPISKGSFWGQPIKPLQYILLDDRFADINLGTFLVDNIFRSALDSYGFPDTLNIDQFRSIQTFYGVMNELVNRRDYESDDQNYLIFEFISCLGIESLNGSHINKLITYEQTNCLVTQPFLSYAYALTSYDGLVKELGVHPLEAAAIVGEVRRRKHEMFDIFHHYTQHSPDVVGIFGNL